MPTEPAAPPAVLVTGATGWLGYRVVEALVGGIPDYERVFPLSGPVRCLVQSGEDATKLRKLGAEPVFGDIRDPEAVRRFVAGADGATLFHLAGIIHPPGRTWWFDAVNYHGTLDLLAASRNAGIRRMVVMSSNSPLGANADATNVFDEASPYNPYMGYGASKWRMEMALRNAMKEHSAPEIVILRSPWFYGTNQPPRQSTFFTMIKNGKFPIFGSGQNRRSMAYTDNIAHGALLAASSPAAAGEIFWIADERPYPMTEIVDTVRNVLRDDFGIPVKNSSVRLPEAIADVARVVDATMQRIGLYHQKIHVLSEMNLTIACTIDKAKGVLGYQPKIELREGMRRSVLWCIENGIAI